jgi:hypothetical protein
VTPDRRRKLLVVLLVAQCVAAAYVVGARAPRLVASRWVQDDAYVSFRYARNLVSGHGLVYNAGAYVEGYTNFLWTILSAVPLAFGVEDPLDFMHAAGGVLWLLSYLLLLRLLLLFFAEGLWIAPLAIVPLAFHWSFNMWFFSGMETPLVCFLTIAAVFFFSLDPERRPRALLWASLCGVLLTMTRPDGAITLAGLALAGVVCDWRRVLVEHRWRTYVVLPALPLLLLYVPFNAWRIWYYGSFYPNTYYAKVAYLPFYQRGWEYLSSFIQIYGLAPWLPILLLGPLCARPGAARRYLWATFFIAVSVGFYLVRLGGDFMEWRFLTPIAGLVYPALVLGFAAVVMRLASTRRGTAGGEVPRGAAAGWAGGLLAMGLLLVVTRGAPADSIEWYNGGHEPIVLLRRYGDPRYDWRAAGQVFDEVLPPKVKVATTAAGMIPFFCDRPVLDLHGLTDPEIAREPITPENRGRVGHEHWLMDHAIMRRRGVDVVLDWADPHPYPRAILRPRDAEGELVSVRLEDGRYVDFILLDPGSFDRAHLAKDPRVVLHGSVEVARPEELHPARQRFGDWKVIDRIDVEDPETERAHSFVETRDDPHRGSWHTKFLRYAPPFDSVQLEDDGRRLPFGAAWHIDGVEAGRPLAVVARYDHTQNSRYRIVVNGKPAARTLEFTSGPEQWGEVWIEIPAELLVAGRNDFRLVRLPDSPGDVELYHLWFLQPGS